MRIKEREEQKEDRGHIKRVKMEHKTAVFCYGSNSTQQLRERVKNDELESYGCFAPQFRRIYCGYSTRWGGGPASIVRVPDHPDEVCYGTVVYLLDEELARLDRFEGIDEGNDPFHAHPKVNLYRREWIHIVLKDSQEQIHAIAYIHNDHTWGTYPSDAYLKACYKNVSPFWPEVDGDKKLKVFDVYGTLRGEFLPSE